MAIVEKYLSGILKNSVLDSLNSQDLREVLEQAEFVKINRGVVLAPSFQALDHVYFITSGMVSLNLTLNDGAIVETGIVGSKGTIGWQALAELDSGPIDATVQIDMTGYRVKASQMIALSDRIKPLRRAIIRAVQGTIDQISQSAACSQRHTSTQRLAKWLLLADDRKSEPTLHISHEGLSILLGIRRAGVTVAMGELRRLGCVKNGHSKIVITSRERLEASACECYSTLKNEAKRRSSLISSLNQG